MSDAKTGELEMSMEMLNQTDEEKIGALMRLGATRRRATFIVTLGHDDVKGDAVNVSDRDSMKAKVS